MTFLPHKKILFGSGNWPTNHAYVYSPDLLSYKRFNLTIENGAPQVVEVKSRRRSSSSKGSRASTSSGSKASSSSTKATGKTLPAKNSTLAEFAKYGLREAIKHIGMNAKGGEIRETKMIVVVTVSEVLLHKRHSRKIYDYEHFARIARKDAESYAFDRNLSVDSEMAAGNLAEEATLIALQRMANI